MPMLLFTKQLKRIVEKNKFLFEEEFKYKTEKQKETFKKVEGHDMLGPTSIIESKGNFFGKKFRLVSFSRSDLE